jgi:hypothetical protein
MINCFKPVHYHYICFQVVSMWLLKKVLVSFSLLLFLLVASCQRMDKTQDGTSKPTGKTLGASAARPTLPDQEPIAPDQVQVLLQVVKVLPVLDKTDTGPCGQSPCRAEVLVEKIIGYGPAFTANIAEGQRLTVYFPMTLQASHERPAVTAGKKLDAKISQPGLEGTAFVMHEFSIHP